MNSETGVIRDLVDVQTLPKTEQVKFVGIDEQLMTLKQKLEMRVSKHDTRSPLGKLRFKTFNNLRNKPCPICGSGKKFKKCCWNKSGLN